MKEKYLDLLEEFKEYEDLMEVSYVHWKVSKKSDNPDEHLVKAKENQNKALKILEDNDGLIDLLQYNAMKMQVED